MGKRANMIQDLKAMGYIDEKHNTDAILEQLEGVKLETFKNDICLNCSEYDNKGCLDCDGLRDDTVIDCMEATNKLTKTMLDKTGLNVNVAFGKERMKLIDLLNNLIGLADRKAINLGQVIEFLQDSENFKEEQK